jgi:hypothetical protein
MIYIAHRGNTTGPSSLENNPDHIKQALDQGFHVEVDIWYKDGKLYTGHDEPTYEISREFLDWRFWCHCKNFEALEYFTKIHGTGNQFQYFWHDKDDHTLTSNGYIWTDPWCATGENSIAVMPELIDATLSLQHVGKNCRAICSDYVLQIRENAR